MIRSSLIALLIPPVLAAQDASRTSFTPVAQVTIRLDSATTAQFSAHRFELRLSHADSAMPPQTEIELAKQAGPYTGALMALGANGSHAIGATVEVPDSLGKTVLRLRLSDVAIVSDHLSLSSLRASLEQQRIGQDEALSALMADYAEAQRQLAAAEELNKAHGNTRMDLARARDRATDLQRRIDLLRKRQALIAAQASEAGPLEETIVLRFGRLEIESEQPGGRAMIGLPAARPPQRR